MVTSDFQLPARSERPRLAVTTVVHGEHGALLAQVDGLSTSSWPPDLHIVVAASDRELSRNRLPIRSDRWDTVIVPGTAYRQAHGAAFHPSVVLAGDAAVKAGAEVIVHVDVRCFPGPGLLQAYAEHARDTTAAGPVVWHAAPAVQLRPPQGSVYPVSGGLRKLITSEASASHPGPTSGPDAAWAESFAVRARDWTTVREAWSSFKVTTSSRNHSGGSDSQPSVPSLIDAVLAVGGAHVEIPDDIVLYRQHPRFAETRYSPGVMQAPTAEPASHTALPQ